MGVVVKGVFSKYNSLRLIFLGYTELNILFWFLQFLIQSHGIKCVIWSSIYIKRVSKSIYMQNYEDVNMKLLVYL